MNYTPENRRRLVEQYLTSAGERVRSAEILLAAGQWADSISRSYYAMLDAASACLIDKDFIPQSHEGTLTLFGLHIIKTGLMDARFSDWLRKIRKARLEADYRHVHVFSQAEAHEACEAARQFVSQVRLLLQTDSAR